MNRQVLITLVGAAIGAGAGWLYWRLAGCTSGGCAITAHPLNSALYGALLGGLLFNTLRSLRRDRPSSTTK